MKTTIKLRLDRTTIEAAKEYALRKETSVSEIVETYLKKLISHSQKSKFSSDSLIGILKKYKNLTDEEIKELYLK